MMIRLEEVVEHRTDERGISPLAPYRALLSGHLASLAALAGVIFLHWSPFAVMMLYWGESAVAGMFNIVHMLHAGIVGPDRRFSWAGLCAGVGTSLFFIVHYGLFMFGHLVFLLVFRQMGGEGLDRLPSAPEGIAGMYVSEAGLYLKTALGSFRGFAASLFLPLALMIISYGRNYARDFLRPGEFDTKGPMDYLFVPYRRIVVMQLALIFGFQLVLQLELKPLPAGMVLVGLKTIVDLVLALRDAGKKSFEIRQRLKRRS